MLDKRIELLVGDNPFHGISHLSQKRARSRFEKGRYSDSEHFAELVNLSLKNGAKGFMFSVSETTLSILKFIEKIDLINLYAIVPYAYEYVRKAAQLGGISGLAKNILRQVILSTSVKTVLPNIKGLMQADLSALFKTYVAYEESRIKSIVGNKIHLKSILIHEIITDMALALNIDWFFKSYIEFMTKSKIRPGFETRNFAYLVEKFRIWKIDLNEVTIAAPFNEIGFQMNPSKTECEEALRMMRAPESEVIAISILASGYFKPKEALSYIRTLQSHLKGVAVGVSKRSHAETTFQVLQNNLNNSEVSKDQFQIS